jgi:hypothetical protein
MLRSWRHRRRQSGGATERVFTSLLLLLHPDFGALRALPRPLLVVDVPLELFHRDLALSTRHVYISIAPKAPAIMTLRTLLAPPTPRRLLHSRRRRAGCTPNAHSGPRARPDGQGAPARLPARERGPERRCSCSSPPPPPKVSPGPLYDKPTSGSSVFPQAQRASGDSTTVLCTRAFAFRADAELPGV